MSGGFIIRMVPVRRPVDRRRQNRGSIAQLKNVSKDLQLKQPVEALEKIRLHLEANAQQQYEVKVNKL